MDKATVEAVKALRDLLDAQRPLDADAERLLREHLWELYDDRALASADDCVRVPRATINALYASYYLEGIEHRLREPDAGSWPRDRIESWLDALMEEAGLESRAFSEKELRAMLAAAAPGEGKR